MVKLITIPKEMSDLERLKTTVMVAKVSQKNYINATRQELAKFERLSDEDVTEFLNEFRCDERLVDTLLSSGKISSTMALDIVEHSNYRLGACVSACIAYEDNENFLLTIIINVIQKNYYNCFTIIEKFAKQISEVGFQMLLNITHFDPKIVRIYRRNQCL